MVNEKSDLEKLAGQMPAGIFEHLKPFRERFFDMNFYGGPGGAGYVETKNYKVLVAKWEQHGWSVMGGGIQWTEWLGIYFAKKEDDNIMEVTTKRIRTRDMHDERNDLKELWFYNLAGIDVLKDNEVLVYWKDREGKKGPSYRVNLDEDIRTIEQKVK